MSQTYESQVQLFADDRNRRYLYTCFRLPSLINRMLSRMCIYIYILFLFGGLSIIEYISL